MRSPSAWLRDKEFVLQVALENSRKSSRERALTNLTCECAHELKKKKEKKKKFVPAVSLNRVIVTISTNLCRLNLNEVARGDNRSMTII
ncbi:hypothetical protein WN51_03596 [Melipona quadrifasciata]|uniref:Uncharacterized protein n=1 Tax=Melipona quadrifasciata TaxID=166423 RepID=A0A0M8ZTW6_9HYME|nr:hypothetical protein WN51_03596 [Melipona quadrifasciata]